MLQLERPRDIFIFQCMIGCRVSDLYSFTKANTINGSIEYVARKTKDERLVTVRVPLNTTAQEILRKYQDCDTFLLFIAQQHYNEAMKKIFVTCGITRDVVTINTLTGEPEIKPINEIASSHMARRTFIGNIYKKVKDTNLVGALSGHKEGSTAFARYRDIDDEMKNELVKMLEE